MPPAPIRRKLVVVGDGACGKTSLLSVFAMGEFPKEYEPTVFENYVAEIRLDGKPVQLALWDTAGQEEYERLRPLSYAKSHVILICFALDMPDSLENVTVKWNEEVRSICGPSIPVLLVGCKRDLRDQHLEGKGLPIDGEVDPLKFVDAKRGQQVATQIGARAYKECSALKTQGIEGVFENATRAAMLVRNPSGMHGGQAGPALIESEKRGTRRRSSGHNGQSGGGLKDDGHGAGCSKGCIIL